MIFYLCFSGHAMNHNGGRAGPTQEGNNSGNNIIDGMEGKDCKRPGVPIPRETPKSIPRTLFSYLMDRMDGDDDDDKPRSPSASHPAYDEGGRPMAYYYLPRIDVGADIQGRPPRLYIMKADYVRRLHSPC